MFSVRDCGEFETPPRRSDPVAERGRGFAFMNLLMDDVRLDARAGETVLRLAKRLPGTPPPAREAEPGRPSATPAWFASSSTRLPRAMSRARCSSSTAG